MNTARMDDEPALTIRLLGNFQMAWAGEPVAGMNQARLQELLAYLALRRGRPLPRQSTAFLFWPDSSERQALTNFRHLLHRLRKTLPEADRFLAVDDLTAQWRDDPACQVDAVAFEAALARARGAADPDERAEQLQRATALYGGEFLPGCYSDWALVERERLAQENARALQQLIVLHEKRRQYREAIGFARELLRYDPLNEPAYTDLMRLHALNGDRAAALHAYHSCATLLRRELDVAPGWAARQMYERLLMQESAPATLPGGMAVQLVGRDKPWADLQQAWRRAAGRPQLALISGEAGIGKSRLAEELVEWVGRQGIAALVARCYATESELAYAPVVTWLRSRPLPALADPWRREVARLMPEALAAQPHLSPPGPLAEKWQRLHLFEALARAMLDDRAALLLFIDDLQWCDGDTLDWLTYLLTDQRIQAGRPQLLVVAALRSGEADDGAKLDAWRSGLAYSGQLVEVALGPLSEKATLMLAGQVAERSVDPRAGAALYRETEGHPLFVIETVRAGLGQRNGAGGAEPAAYALPDRVRQVLETRLAQLSPPARGVIEAAAVIGRAFTYEVLRHATDPGEDELIHCLDEAWRRRIIREQGEADYDFSHDKLRQVAYEGLSRARRRHLHGRIAAALEAAHAADLDSAAGAIGGHYEAAGTPEKAIAWLARGAAAAARVHAHREGLALVARGMGLLAAWPGDGAGAVWAARLQETAGDSRYLLAQHEAAREAYETALAHAPPEERVGRARLRRKIGSAVMGGNGKFEEAAAHYEEAEATLGPPAGGDEPDVWQEWCQIQLDHASLLYWWHHAEEMKGRIAAIRDRVERHGTAEQWATLLSLLSRQAISENRFGPTQAGLDNARAALAALPAGTPPEKRTLYQCGYGFTLLWQDEYDAAEAALREALALSEMTGDVTLQARCLTHLMIAARRRGRDGEAAALAQRGLERAEAARAYSYIGAAQAGLGWVAWRAGSNAEAGELARAALASWGRQEQVYPLQWQALWPLVALALEQGQVAEAIDHARMLLRPNQQALPDAVAGALAEGLAAWEAGQAATARRRLARALATAQQMNYA